MSDITKDNVLTKKAIKWDYNNIVEGITPVSKAHFDEVDDTLDAIQDGINAHKASTYTTSGHGAVTTLQNGFLTKELYLGIIDLKNRITIAKNNAAKLISPPKIVIVYDKAPNTLDNNDWVWCDGSNGTSLIKNKVVMGANVNVTYPVYGYTNTDLSKKDITEHSITGSYMERRI